LEAALDAEKHSDVLVLMGDFNASTGVAEDANDEVCGAFGIPHVNDAGRSLKMAAATCQLKDLLTFEEQKFYGTWVHAQSKNWHQLDKVFMKQKHRCMVNKCVNGEMLKMSDHFSVRLNLSIFNPPKPTSTLRRTRNGKAISEFFGKAADEKIREAQVWQIAKEHECRLKDGGSKHEQLMAAVPATVGKLPKKKRPIRGWCDANVELLNAEVEIRSAAARTYATTKTEEARLLLKLVHARLKKLKKMAKNKWMLEQLRECNGKTLTPSGN
jgi:hypothetical protein